MPRVLECPSCETPPEAFRARHVSQTPTPKEPSGSIASKPRVPSAQLREHSREHFEHATCPRVPQAGRIPPEVVRECHVSRAIRPPGIPLGSATFPAKVFPGDHPEHSASTPRVPGVFPSPPILENTRKMSRTLQIHRNSSFSQKNPKPIFTVSS